MGTSGICLDILFPALTLKHPFAEKLSVRQEALEFCMITLQSLLAFRNCRGPAEGCRRSARLGRALTRGSPSSLRLLFTSSVASHTSLAFLPVHSRRSARASVDKILSPRASSAYSSQVSRRWWYLYAYLRDDSSVRPYS